MDIPNYVGLKINNALKELKKNENEYEIVIKETISPIEKNNLKNRECRVVRQRNYDNTIEITVSYF